MSEALDRPSCSADRICRHPWARANSRDLQTEEIEVAYCLVSAFPTPLRLSLFYLREMLTENRWRRQYHDWRHVALTLKKAPQQDRTSLISFATSMPSSIRLGT